ncbi:hypothetical protein H2O64_02030 [Kordia sp. YSTF-M3]|uniref:Outer membrane protein beta-barrel domain-containing protein n=1 Tax=Kordia aestuariivivens TaxID=2759037 RepID=A0ABR7Q4E2_9FLAO|nr:hypothetical protein [Kordia aestuariivivens]MBC8753431.1 hypothetical protein [Kordia aestuariivivens]
MKKYIIIVCMVVPMFIFSQEKNGLNFRSIAINPLSVTNAGLAINADLSFMNSKNIYTLSGYAGTELTFPFDNKTSEDSFQDYSLLWGREVKIENWLRLEGHAGLGYFLFKTEHFNDEIEDEKKTTIGVPLLSKLKFMLGNHFSIGIQFRANINSAKIVRGGGIFFQYDI